MKYIYTFKEALLEQYFFNCELVKILLTLLLF